MVKRSCLKCGRKVGEDSVDGIEVKICCTQCCLNFVVPIHCLYPGKHRIPEKLAKKIYGCSTEDLFLLNSCTLRYPKNNRLTKLYLGAEVTALGHLKNGERWKEQRAKRRRKLEKSLGVRLNKLDADLVGFLIGDYLQIHWTPSTSLEDIKRRLSVLGRVKEMRGLVKYAHPGSLFDFCIDYPQGTAADYEEFRSSVRRVFRLEGDRILSCLTKAERDSLLDTPLKDVVRSFGSRDKEHAIQSLLEKLTSPETAAQIMKHSACQLRIQREENKDEAARKLSQFWNERGNIKERKERLATAFKEKGVRHSSSTLPQKHFIHGQIDCDPEEIVGLEDISINGPFNLLSPDRIERVSIAVTKFEECLYSKSMPYAAAFEEAIDYAKRVPLPVGFGIFDTWDYQQLACGHWSNRWYKL